jgi:hypothetical protein
MKTKEMSVKAEEMFELQCLLSKQRDIYQLLYGS